MKGYAEQRVFTAEDLSLFHQATDLVSKAIQPPIRTWEDWIRCHELARAVGRILDLEVQDGQSGIVNHSWLWTRGRFPKILDVYAVGRLPQVQLVDPVWQAGYWYEPPGLDMDMLYRPWPEGKTPVEIDEVQVQRLVATMRVSSAEECRWEMT